MADSSNFVDSSEITGLKDYDTASFEMVFFIKNQPTGGFRHSASPTNETIRSGFYLDNPDSFIIYEGRIFTYRSMSQQGSTQKYSPRS